jgi:hypothetical protein
VIVDGGEIGDHLWTPPAAALALHGAGGIELVPPTWVTLQRLAEAGAVADGATAAVEAAAGGEIERFKTRVVIQDGVLVTVWDPDAGYAAGELDAPGARHRLVMDPAGWRYERSG